MFAGCYYTFQYLFGVLYMEGLYNIFQSKTVLADPKRGASTWQVVSKVANFSGNIFRKAEISPQHILRVLPVFSRERILRIYLSAFRRSTLLVNIRGRDKKLLPTKKPSNNASWKVRSPSNVIWNNASIKILPGGWLSQECLGYHPA